MLFVTTISIGFAWRQCQAYDFKPSRCIRQKQHRDIDIVSTFRFLSVKDICKTIWWDFRNPPIDVLPERMQISQNFVLWAEPKLYMFSLFEISKNKKELQTFDHVNYPVIQATVIYIMHHAAICQNASSDYLPFVQINNFGAAPGSSRVLANQCTHSIFKKTSNYKTFFY